MTLHNVILALLIITGIESAAQETLLASVDEVQKLVEYPADFFSRYKPNTALDMVQQLPGFKLDDGDGTRGFASSGGNLLINGRRPSAKQDLPSATLARIPANQVERIELLRGQAIGIDFQGQSILANVILRSDNPAIVRWEYWLEHNRVAPFKTGGSISMADRIGQVDLIGGIDMERDTSGWMGAESKFDGKGVLLETGPTDRTEKGFRINSLSLNGSTMLGENTVNFNSRLTGNKTDYYQPNSSFVQPEGVRRRDVIIRSTNKNLEYELGGDVERHFSDALTGKLVLLYNNDDSSVDSSQENLDSELGRTLLREADTDTERQEQITRIETDWTGWTDHAVQLNMERAYNVLERGLLQTDDRGIGPVPVDVPGANSRVKEVRWDVLLQDTWTLGRFELDLGTGAEASTLTQTGDANLERDFFFVKPLAILSYSSGQGNRTRLRAAREVSQLDLTDFVTATLFEDNDLSLGNPNIRPETTWKFELSHEHRFDSDKVVKLTAFYHAISDVLDLLPLSATFEAPGNIGDGKVKGVELETSFPLDWLGLQNAKLDVRGLVQDTEVTDPVTGEERRMSGQGGASGYRTLGTQNININYHVRADFRQDFEKALMAWGWTIAERGSRPLYKVNELDVSSEGTAINIFVETTRWFGVKLRVVADNVLSYDQHRERTLFAGERDLSPVDTVIIRDRKHDLSRFSLYMNGSF